VGLKLGLGDRLMIHPDLALAKDFAYAIMSYGMRNGTFTGKRLATYISGAKADYENARRIINGTDQAVRIARYAGRFETMLLGSIPVVEKEPEAVA
jgi:putative chitinase